MPSLFHLMVDGLLPDEFTVITVAREPLDDDVLPGHRWGTRSRPSLPDQRSRSRAEGLGAGSRRSCDYISGELDDPARTYTIAGAAAGGDRREAARREAGTCSISPFPPASTRRPSTGWPNRASPPRVPDPKQRPWVRIIIEKPFGRSLESAGALNACVRRAFAEHQVYRIDHYLGKETVQNLLVFRFANSIFEPVWNRQHVHHVQITAAESVGVEHRGKYYEEAGVVRDMFQNHLLQLLTLMAMEPPVTFSADAVRDEKVKVLRAIRPVTPAVMHDYAVRGQYGPGHDQRQAGPRLSGGAERRARQRHADVLRHPLHDRQLALAATSRSTSAPASECRGGCPRSPSSSGSRRTSCSPCRRARSSSPTRSPSGCSRRKASRCGSR